MEKREFIQWIYEIKSKLPIFLEKMRGNKRPGFFKYSLSGDLFGENIKWGLGNSVFALKIYYTINEVPNNLEDIIEFILSFQQPSGEFYDPLIKFLSFPTRFFYSITTGDFSNITNTLTKRAETRQAICVLKYFGFDPKYKYTKFPKSKAGIDRYLKSLNWHKPWSAGSHFSHLIFFIAHSPLENKEGLISYAIKWINRLQKDDGAWYVGNPPLREKINGAMKVITALKVATSIAGYNGGEIFFENAEKLVDLALTAANDEHACDNFNVTYVLRYASEVLGNSYRYKEIEDFMKSRLDIYKSYYYPNYGAFSFFPRRANKMYYGAPISRGKPEPDIHGTMMFMWGLSVIGEFWKLNRKLGLREHIP